MSERMDEGIDSFGRFANNYAIINICEHGHPILEVKTRIYLGGDEVTIYEAVLKLLVPIQSCLLLQVKRGGKGGKGLRAEREHCFAVSCEEKSFNDVELARTFKP